MCHGSVPGQAPALGPSSGRSQHHCSPRACGLVAVFFPGRICDSWVAFRAVSWFLWEGRVPGQHDAPGATARPFRSRGSAALVVMVQTFVRSFGLSCSLFQNLFILRHFPWISSVRRRFAERCWPEFQAEGRLVSAPGGFLASGCPVPGQPVSVRSGRLSVGRQPRSRVAVCSVCRARPAALLSRLLRAVRSLLQALGARVRVSGLLDDAPRGLSLQTALLGPSFCDIT